MSGTEPPAPGRALPATEPPAPGRALPAAELPAPGRALPAAELPAPGRGLPAAELPAPGCGLLDAEPPASNRGPLDAEWRAEAARAQERALPAGHVVVSCAASLGVAGLGRHAHEIVDALERRGEGSSFCISAHDSDEGGGSWRGASRRRALARALGPLGRVSPARRVSRAWGEFDRYAANRLPRGEHLIAFSGQALAQLGAAHEQRYRSVALVSGGVHVRSLVRRHEAAHRRYPLERSHARRVPERQLLEYEQAHRIYVASAYTWESFAEHGAGAEKLERFPLTPHPRFQPAAGSERAATFDLVYVGGLSVAKGVPLLIDAMRRLPYEDLRLVLVGGWKSRGMRRFVERARAADPRIGVVAGDPLPYLQRARLCAHPSYADGFAYGAAEALACGVPVLASEDTGMKELIEPGRTGMVLPTGDLEALSEAIDSAYRGELFGG
ncbi:MAG TPA: glycosyltransferase [Solirubrobacteraceae bacterium]|jgi:glycosyltransferase involved in cell wall biosynthesis|nr:glycosyltransferase [Solirubrobacteraceae bacterium]